MAMDMTILQFLAYVDTLERPRAESEYRLQGKRVLAARAELNLAELTKSKPAVKPWFKVKAMLAILDEPTAEVKLSTVLQAIHSTTGICITSHAVQRTLHKQGIFVMISDLQSAIAQLEKKGHLAVLGHEIRLT